MKKMIFILIPVLAIGGVVVAGLKGIINIPGLTPKKAKGGLYGEGAGLYGEGASMYGEGKEDPAGEPPEETAKTPDPEPKKKADEPTIDPIVGAKKLAKLWNNLETSQLLLIIKDWKDEDLARVLAQMDPEKASALLASMASTQAPRASKLSAIIEQNASKVPAVSGK